MLRQIKIEQLRVGMFITNLDCGWMDHPFVISKFLIRNDDQIRKIFRAGIRAATIDCSRGLDIDFAPTVEEAKQTIEDEVVALAKKQSVVRRTTIQDELERAVVVRRQAVGLVKAVMQDARLGRAVELDRVSPLVEDITESVFRNPSALLGLLQIKSKDDYTFLHSVSVCALLVAFCRARSLDSEMIYQAGLGGLLHDVGKALVPDHILNKPGRLTEEEFSIIKRHPKDGFDILTNTDGIGAIPLDITLHHHERRDGSGYPDKLPEGEISELAQMAAIVDVYDAITADRCYHKGMSPAEALRKMYEWSKFHFDPALTQEFMKCVGIYPVGTLVLLESGKLGVVIEPHESSLLTPKVNVFYNTKSKVYVRPHLVDLSKRLGFGGGDRIVSYESPEKWKVDPQRFMHIG